MIIVTRLNGGQFGVNPDLIQRVECAPDTILTLIDGTKFIVAEPLDEIVARIHEYRSRVLARARDLSAERREPPTLEVVEGGAGTGADDADRPVTPPVPLRPRGV